MSAPLQIGLFVDASRAYGRGIFEGVAAFVENREDWVILTHARPEVNALPAWIKKSRLDAIIAYIPNRTLHRSIQELGIPAVDVHGRYRSPSIPLIESSAASIVRLGVEFFGYAGFEHLAYCGFPGVFFSDQREEAFRAQLAQLRRKAHIFTSPVAEELGEDLYEFEKSNVDDSLAEWLQSLPKPVAVLACNDIRGGQVINACRQAGIKVPEEVAVMGVDNDELIWRLCRPTLSSIEPDVKRIGFLAAQMIDDQLQGKPVLEVQQVQPRGLLQRASTDAVIAEHPVVVAAARLLRDSKHSDASVERISKLMGVSRSTLDKFFLKDLGRSVASEIGRIRLQRAQDLLRHTEMPLSEVARRCGFASDTYFCRFFKRVTGETPNSFRKK